MAEQNNLIEDMQKKIVHILKEESPIPGLEAFTSKPNEVTIEEDPLFLTGKSSVIVRVRAGDGSTVIAKHAPPYARGFGEVSTLSPVRTELEMTGLQLFQQYSPGSAAKAYFYSSKHNIVLIEDLVGYKTLYFELIAGNVNKVAIGTLAVHMARIHRSTHKDNNPQEWAKLQDLLKLFTDVCFRKFQPLIDQLYELFVLLLFINESQDEVTEQLKEIADRRVFSDSKLSERVEQFRVDLFNTKDCLVHGDNQTRNMMVRGDDVKFIDHEFVRLGGCSWEVGLMLGDMIQTYYYHLVSQEDVDRHRQIAREIRDCTHHMVDTYIENMYWCKGDPSEHLRNFLKQVAGYAGYAIFLLDAFGMVACVGPSRIRLFEASIRLMEQHHEVDSVDMIYSILALERTEHARP